MTISFREKPADPKKSKLNHIAPMKKIKPMQSLFAAVFCFCTYFAFAQSNYVAGSITQKDGTIVSGQIDYREWITTPRQIRFRASPESAAITYGCHDLAAFSITFKNEIYESAIVDVNNEPVEISRLREFYENDTISHQVALDRDTVFLLVLAKGRLNLFTLHDSQSKIHYFIQKDGGSVEELIYRRMKILVPAPGGSTQLIPRIGEINDYKNQLNLATLECPALQNRIQKTFYSYGILRVVEEYNQCIGQSAYVRPKDKAAHSFYAFAGGSSAFVSFNDYYHLKSLSLTTPLAYQIGAGFDFGLNRTNNRMSVSLEANYMNTRIDFSSTLNQLDGSSGNLDYKISLKSIRFNALAKYVVYNGKWQPYVKAGVGLSSYFDTAYTRTLSNGSTSPTVTKRKLDQSEIFLTGILGLRFHRFFVEGRFDAGTDINKVEKEDLKMNRLSIVAGCSFRL